MIRVCSAQISGIWENPEKTLEKIRPFIRHAASSGADLIVFPEQFATGWDPLSTKNIQDLNGTIVPTLREYARESSIAILGSFRERTQTDRPRNSAIVIGKTGEILANYAKMHLFSPAHEEEKFSPGAELGIFSLGPLKCGIAICYDLRFPSLFQIYADQGVQAVFVPAAWPKSRIRYWEMFLTSRAAENQMYLIGVNTTGTTAVDDYSGSSMTINPDGTIISRANDAEQLLFSDLDPDRVAAIRNAFPVSQDRKHDLYQALLQNRK
jgi:predicted amidohydrolase